MTKPASMTDSGWRFTARYAKRAKAAATVLRKVSPEGDADRLYILTDALSIAVAGQAQKTAIALLGEFPTRHGAQARRGFQVSTATAVAAEVLESVDLVRKAITSRR